MSLSKHTATNITTKVSTCIVIALLLTSITIFAAIKSVIKTKQLTLSPITQIINFSPPSIPALQKQGSCFSISTAAQSNVLKTWRCTTENLIYDPCFELKSNRIVCNIAPSNSNSGFELIPTKPLPENEYSSKNDNNIWTVLLTDGSFCVRATGTTPNIDGVPYLYSCSNNEAMWLKGSDTTAFNRSSLQWTAELAYFDPNSPDTITKIETVGIVKAWK